MAELKHCPFCKSTDIRKRITVSTGKTRCYGCGASISKCFYNMFGSIAEAKEVIDVVLTKAWNRRAKDAILDDKGLR